MSYLIGLDIGTSGVKGLLVVLQMKLKNLLELKKVLKL